MNDRAKCRRQNVANIGQVSELVSLENERREKLFLEEEARAELFRRVGPIRNISKRSK